MVWIWCIAVVATLVGFALAWRAVVRADQAVATLAAASETGDDLVAATDVLRGELGLAAEARQVLADRTLDVGT